MKVQKYTLKKAQKHLPKRLLTSSKITGGKTLIYAGSKGMWGASILCAQAAARTGSGYTYLLLENKNNFPVQKNPDFLTLDRWPKDLSPFGALAIGPGLSPKTDLLKIIKNLILKKVPHVVLDAEALNHLSKMKTKLTLPDTWVLTPHEGELARLIGKTSRWVKANRITAAQLCQKKWGCVVLLKGHESIVMNDSQCFKIQSGNPALAKAGTGDVLTGMIASLMSQKLNTLDATGLATFIHGFIADQWIKNGNDELSLLASDLINGISKNLKIIRNH